VDNWTRFNVLVLIFLSTGLGILGYYASAVPAPSIGAIIEPGSLANSCNFIVYVDGSTYLVKNGQTGANSYSGTDPDSIIQNALDGLTAGRTWKETVCMKGSFTGLSTALQLSSYTIFDARGAAFQWGTNTGGSFKAIVKNGPVSDESSTYNDIEVWGGLYNGNAANQASESDRGAISFRNVYNILIVNPTITSYKGLAGIYIAPLAGQSNQFSMNVQIMGCKISDVQGTAAPEHGSGIVISGTGGGVRVQGCDISNTRQGINIGDSRQDDWIESSFIHDLRTSDGIEGIAVASSKQIHLIGNLILESGTVGIRLNPCNDCEIRGGEVRNSGHRLANPGISVQSSMNVTISGVRSWDSQAVKTQNYGIQTSGTSDYALIIGNDCRGNSDATEDIDYVNTNNKIVYNIGRYTTQGSA